MIFLSSQKKKSETASSVIAVCFFMRLAEAQGSFDCFNFKLSSQMSLALPERVH